MVLTGGSPGAHTGLTYQPDANYCNSGTPDTFTYTLTGGSTATVSVTVTCAPDNPVVDTSAGSTSYTENAAATVIDAAVTVSDADAGTDDHRRDGADHRQLRRRGGRPGAGPARTPASRRPSAATTLTLTGNASRPPTRPRCVT